LAYQALAQELLRADRRGRLPAARGEE
jgi:hypothetical protein